MHDWAQDCSPNEYVNPKKNCISQTVWQNNDPRELTLTFLKTPSQNSSENQGGWGDFSQKQQQKNPNCSQRSDYICRNMILVRLSPWSVSLLIRPH